MNSINMSDSVAVIVRNGGQPWAGSKLNLESNLDFSSMAYLSMKVYTLAPVGTPVKLKLEGNGGAETEVDVFTTLSGEWETLSWDFTGQPTDFNSLVFMFDFGTVGDSSATSTFLFDDIEQTSDDISTSIDPVLTIEGVRYFPNPAKDHLTITSDHHTISAISIFDMLGNQVSVHYPDSRTITIDITDFASGIYMAKIATPAGEKSSKIMIE